MLALFSLAIFVGAALLFLVQPMIARLVLPTLGGSPAVWNTCMVFFQALLLGGYAWAHWSVKWLGVRRQAPLHGLLMLAGLLALPIALPQGAPPPDAWPVPWLLGALAYAVGVPFVLVSTGGPVLQRWFAETGHRAAKDPYFLYAASNAGSLLALVAYPLVIEPQLALVDQRRLWAIGYIVFATLVAACVVAVLRSRGAPSAQPEAEAVTAGDVHDTPLPPRWRWIIIALAFIPSSLMLGTTHYLTTDIAAFPLLWVVPLAIYLLTFILAFAKRRVISTRGLSFLAAIVLTGLAVAFLAQGQRLPAWAMFSVHLLSLAVIALLCHTRLADLRPPTARLTEFYLLISVGGVLGGMFNALLAPLIFNFIAEYPLVLAAACLVRVVKVPDSTGVRRALHWLLFPLIVGLAALILGTSNLNPFPEQVRMGVAIGVPAALLYLLLARSRVGFAVGFLAMAIVGHALDAGRSSVVHRDRTFFGVLRIDRFAVNQDTPPATVTELVHSTTIHGLQFSDDARRVVPAGYYHPEGPLGDVFKAHNDTPLFDRIGLVGLGTGAIAAYGRPGQELIFHEIDPQVERLNREGKYFTYVNDALARGVKLEIVLGDGRRTVEAEPDGLYGLIVLDAFSSDAIPVHLLTREAMEIYARKLKPGGLIAVHVSNQYMELRPVVARIAKDLGLTGMQKWDGADASERWNTGRLSSDWMVLARREEDLARIRDVPGWTMIDPNPKAPLWTDEFSNVLSVMTW